MGDNNSTTLEDQIANFDPSNPEALAALEKSVMGGTEVPPVVDPDATAVSTEAETKEPAKQDEKQATPHVAEPVTEAKLEGASSSAQVPEGVQAKDGKHIIPYSVLERERDRASRAEQTALALSQQLEQLQTGKTPTAGDANVGQLTDEDLVQLDQDLPGVAKAIRAQMALIGQLTGKIQTLQNGQEVQQQSAEQVRKDEEEAAIAANATLSALRDSVETDPKANARWNKVVDTYTSLRNDPEFFHLDTASLINKAESAVTALYGGTPAPVAKPAPIQQPQKTDTDLKQAADAKLKEMPAAVPTSLSDIPGGVPPAQSDLENLENASAVALGNKFMSMTPDQMESYIARTGL